MALQSRRIVWPLPRFPSLVHGVGHSARDTATSRFRFSSSARSGDAKPVIAVRGVGHTAAATCRGNWSIRLLPSGRCATMPGESFQSRVVAVIHSAISMADEPEPVASVGRVDGTSRDNGRPAGVADAFQVSTHSVEPVLANRCRNLFSHECSGPAGADESEKVGPQVPIVSLGFALAGDRERLARRGAGP